MASEQKSNEIDPKQVPSVAVPTPQIIKTNPPKQVAQRETHARLSYVYQLATLSRVQDHPEVLSRMYNKNFSRILKKNVLKVSPHIKRTICKLCDRMLIEGINGDRTLVGKGKGLMLEITCKCGEVKRFPIGKNPDYELFIDKSSIDVN